MSAWILSWAVFVSALASELCCTSHQAVKLAYGAKPELIVVELVMKVVVHPDWGILAHKPWWASWNLSVFPHVMSCCRATVGILEPGRVPSCNVLL